MSNVEPYEINVTRRKILTAATGVMGAPVDVNVSKVANGANAYRFLAWQACLGGT